MSPPTDLAKLVILSPAIIMRKSGDLSVILNADTAELYSCNRTASAFLREIDGKRTLAEIVEAVLPVFDADPGIMRAELAGLADMLSAAGIIAFV